MLVLATDFVVEMQRGGNCVRSPALEVRARGGDQSVAKGRLLRSNVAYSVLLNLNSVKKGQTVLCNLYSLKDLFSILQCQKVFRTQLKRVVRITCAAWRELRELHRPGAARARGTRVVPEMRR